MFGLDANQLYTAIIAVVGGGISLLGVLFTAYQTGRRSTQDLHAQAMRQKDSQIEQLNLDIKTKNQSIDTYRSTGSDAAISQRIERIRVALDELRSQYEADKATFYVPVRNNRNYPIGVLAIVSAPENNVLSILGNRILSSRTMEAYRSFANRRALAVSTGENAYSRKFDSAAFRPTHMLSLPYYRRDQHGDIPNGVVQLIRGQTGRSFEDTHDLVKAARDIGLNGNHFDEKTQADIEFFAKSISQLSLLGVEVDRHSLRGCCVVFDLTDSRYLWRDDSLARATTIFLDSVIAETGAVIREHRGSLVSFTGDGFIAFFQDYLGPAGEASYGSAHAYDAALALSRKFGEIIARSNYKLITDRPAPDQHFRLVLASGLFHLVPLIGTGLGQGSLVGAPMTAANHIDHILPRDRSVIACDENTYRELLELQKIKAELCEERQAKGILGNRNDEYRFYLHQQP
jgi:class 3 adenylate cyclase/gas vesicle protein